MTSPSKDTPQWVRSFRNILALENANGFSDKAVIGGMDGFVRQWAQDMAARVKSLPESRSLIRPGYSGMSVAERREWVGRWQSLLNGDDAPALPETERQEATEKRKTPNRLKSGAARPRAPSVSRPTVVELDSPVTDLPRVSARQTSQLSNLGIATVRDLLYHFPHRYDDFSRQAQIAELWPGMNVTVTGQITQAEEIPLGRSRKKATVATLSDETGQVRITWFGQGFLAKTLKAGASVAVSGRVDAFQNRPVFESPEYDLLRGGQPALNTGRLVPVYPLTSGLVGRTLRSHTWQGLKAALETLPELLPEEVRKRNNLMPLRDAVRQAHYPDSHGHSDRARRRLAFDELLILLLSVLSRRQRENRAVEGPSVAADSELLHDLIPRLPFELTGAQLRSLEEILADLRQGTPPMNRLLQGEVGSGKTVVVLLALLAVISSGYQGAIMVPTEVLAEQHFQTVTRLLGGMADTTQAENQLTVYLESLGRPMTVGLLTGSTRARHRERLKGLAAEGTLDLLIGTHALIQDGVEMPRLALAVMDEQHRFGVNQRSALRLKSEENPHILVMSATPIPRTLQLTFFGDLEISTIDELPPGRQEIATRWAEPDKREAVYHFVRQQVGDGRQAFIVCPLIDESEAIVAKAAADEHQRLAREIFPDLKLDLLHGRMSSADKDKVMRRFRDGESHILVTTAVVEVGIDVPNATVMLIEGADRFGLSQLHQFRGRVGRGEHRSYCILMSDDPSESARERLKALENNRDGFQLAEIDLELRGPGDFFGTRQSGLPNLRMARLSDRDLLEIARREAAAIIESDPELARDEHAALSAQVARFLEGVSSEFS
ncbi:MAG: ATP-dependent DNA helicase RecG [Chloroflexi bacterium]|nr:ATP-dependent DNA helicase RecG [Chloroflexota bacterium]